MKLFIHTNWEKVSKVFAFKMRQINIYLGIEKKKKANVLSANNTSNVN